MESPTSTGTDHADKPREEKTSIEAYFGVYDEGGTVLSLYMTPFSAASAARAVEALALGGALLDVTPAGTPWDPRPLSTRALAIRQAPLEVLHVPDLQGPLPGPLTLMGDPHEALPEEGGRAFALSLHDIDHAVIYSHDPRVLAMFLQCWLEDVLDVMLDASGPGFTQAALDAALEPMPPQAWRQVLVATDRKVWSLDLSARVNEAVGQQVQIDDLRFVGGPDRAWRAGWSW